LQKVTHRTNITSKLLISIPKFMFSSYWEVGRGHFQIPVIVMPIPQWRQCIQCL